MVTFRKVHGPCYINVTIDNMVLWASLNILLWLLFWLRATALLCFVAPFPTTPTFGIPSYKKGSCLKLKAIKLTMDCKSRY